MYKLISRYLRSADKSLPSYRITFQKFTQQNISPKKLFKSNPKLQQEYKREKAYQGRAGNGSVVIPTKNTWSYFCRKCNPKSFPDRLQFSMLSTSSGNNFNLSDIKLDKNKLERLKRTGLAANYYKDGTKQCNKIREKYKKAFSHIKFSWIPRPFLQSDESYNFVKTKQIRTTQPKAFEDDNM